MTPSARSARLAADDPQSEDRLPDLHAEVETMKQRKAAEADATKPATVSAVGSTASFGPTEPVPSIPAFYDADGRLAR